VHVIAALPAVLGLVLEPEEAELAAAVVELARELPRLLPLVDVGSDLLGDEPAPDAPAELESSLDLESVLRSETV